MDVTTPMAPRVLGFVPFVGKKDVGQRDVRQKDVGQKDVRQKDVGQKDGAPQSTPTRDFPLMSGEETTDPVPFAHAVVRTPSDAAWDLKGATVYYRRALIKFCDSEGHLKPCDVKMPIAMTVPRTEPYARSSGFGAQLGLT